ncbi:IS66 family insertion sequence element accessory protein TnpB [Mesorhizobium caraganae]|uniref:IS66 family insertion sequence element accessory protein TnpB n=1 Tax=Mesorhizobium caraganae TaxID=483206 RepID=UPI003336ADE1
MRHQDILWAQETLSLFLFHRTVCYTGDQAIDVPFWQTTKYGIKIDPLTCESPDLPFASGIHTDMRKGHDGLATLIQEHLKKDPFSGHPFVFRGKNTSLLKIPFGMARGFACSPSESTVETSGGRVGGARWLGAAVAGATRDAARSDRLAYAGALLATASGQVKFAAKTQQIEGSCCSDTADVVEDRDGEIEHLHSIIKQLQRAQVGYRSVNRLGKLEAPIGREFWKPFYRVAGLQRSSPRQV